MLGTFTANDFTVNSNHGTGTCSHLDTSFNTYGLVVGTLYNATDIHVHGAAYLPPGTDTSQSSIEILDTGCSAYTNLSTGLLDFQQAYTNAEYSQIYYSELKPTMVLDSNGVLTTIANKTTSFDVITFNTCNDNDCPLYPGNLSDPTAMLYGRGNWNGPQGET